MSEHQICSFGTNLYISCKWSKILAEFEFFLTVTNILHYNACIVDELISELDSS